MLKSILKGFLKTLLVVISSVLLVFLTILGIKIVGNIFFIFFLIVAILITLFSFISDEIKLSKKKEEDIQAKAAIKTIRKLSHKFDTAYLNLEAAFLSTNGRPTDEIRNLIRECEDIIDELTILSDYTHLHIEYLDRLKELLDFYNY